MSLVNDMLNDLEQRRSEQQHKPVNLDWLTGQSTPARKRSLKAAYIVSMIAVVILVVIVAWLYRPTASLDYAGQLLNPTRDAQRTAPGELVPASSELRGVQWIGEGNVTRVQLQLSAVKPYGIHRVEGGVSIRLYDIENKISARDLKPQPPVQSVSVQQQANDVVATLNIEGEFSFSDRVITDPANTNSANTSPANTNRGSTVEVVIQSLAAAKSTPAPTSTPAAATPAVQPAVKKTSSNKLIANSAQPASPSLTKANAALPQKPATERATKPAAVRNQQTLSQQDMQLAQQAKNLLRKGDTYQAEQLLKDFVSQQPQALRSGKLLASIWLSQQRFTLVADQLDMMLQRAPGDIELRVLKARLLLAEGEANAAVDWLMMARPAVEMHQDYYELLGLAARQNNQYPLSEQVYRGLINSDNRRGDWWVGLAIALDAQAKNGEARSAYQQALMAPRISAPLKQYAQQRLSAAN